MTQEKRKPLLPFLDLEPWFIATLVATIAILIFLIIYVIKVEQRFRRNTAVVTKISAQLDTHTNVISEAMPAVSQQLSEIKQQANENQAANEALAKQIKALEKRQAKATGRPTFRSTTRARVGQKLHAGTEHIADANGLTRAVFHYQWSRSHGDDDSAIAGATGDSYTPVWQDTGKGIKVHVSFIDDAGNEEKVNSLEIKVEKRWRDCEECPWMVVAPAGSFMMGSPSGEKGRLHDEDPQHGVTIAAAFAVGVYEVTFREWDACVNSRGCVHKPDEMDWGRDNRPVIDVSWHDAQAYVEWLSKKTGKRYRLLSESEWEYVARAGATGPFHTGSISIAQANYGGERTVPVGLFEPNAFGLHDVHGNVEEWTQDCRNNHYRGAPNDGSAWEIGNCQSRVARGGSWWRTDKKYIRAAYRGMWNSTIRRTHVGFRVARDLTMP